MDKGGSGSSIIWNTYPDVPLDYVVISFYYWD